MNDNNSSSLACFNAAGAIANYCGVWNQTLPNAVYTIAGNTNGTGVGTDVFIMQTSSGLLKPHLSDEKAPHRDDLKRLEARLDEWGVTDAMNLLAKGDEKSWDATDRRTVELFGERARQELNKQACQPIGARARASRRLHVPIVVDQDDLDSDKDIVKVAPAASRVGQVSVKTAALAK